MKRQQITDKIGQLLARITIANGFNTDLGLKLAYWQDYASEYGEPILIYRDLEEEAVEKGDDHENTLQVEIEGRKPELPIEPNKILQDIIRAIGYEPNLAGLAIKVFPPSNQTLVETDGKVVSRVIVNFTIVYRTRRFQP